LRYESKRVLIMLMNKEAERTVLLSVKKQIELFCFQ